MSALHPRHVAALGGQPVPYLYSRGRIIAYHEGKWWHFPDVLNEWDSRQPAPNHPRNQLKRRATAGTLLVQLAGSWPVSLIDSDLTPEQQEDAYAYADPGLREKAIP